MACRFKINYTLQGVFFIEGMHAKYQVYYTRSVCYSKNTKYTTQGVSFILGMPFEINYTLQGVSFIQGMYAKFQVYFTGVFFILGIQ